MKLWKFELDCFFARFRLYRWVMWKVFGRRYYIAEFKHVHYPIEQKPTEMIFFKREP